MEFNLSTDIVKAIPKAIVFNYEELKTEVAESIEPYKAMVVTENDISNAKTDRAKLNKLKTALNDKKKEVKAQYIEPYSTFENQIKDIISIIDDGINNIDKQVKAIDEKEIGKKWKQIEQYYEEIIGSYWDMLPIETIVNPKWKNKGCSMSEIKEEMDAKVHHFDTDIKSIMASDIANKNVVIGYYADHPFDLGSAMLRANKSESQQNALKKAFGNHYKDTLSKLEEATNNDSNDTTKDLKVLFHDTTSDFRKEMKELCIKHDIFYEGI